MNGDTLESAAPCLVERRMSGFVTGFTIVLCRSVTTRDSTDEMICRVLLTEPRRLEVDWWISADFVAIQNLGAVLSNPRELGGHLELSTMRTA